MTEDDLTRAHAALANMHYAKWLRDYIEQSINNDDVHPTYLKLQISRPTDSKSIAPLSVTLLPREAIPFLSSLEDTSKATLLDIGITLK